MADNDILTDAAAAEIKQRVRCTGRCLSDVAALLADRRARIAELAAVTAEMGRLRQAATDLLRAVDGAIEPIYAMRQIDRGWGPLNDARKKMTAALTQPPEPRP